MKKPALKAAKRMVVSYAAYFGTARLATASTVKRLFNKLQPGDIGAISKIVKTTTSFGCAPEQEEI